MRRIIVVALAVLGVCMAATASAPAQQFHANKTGTLLGLSTGNQTFTTTPEGAKVVCTHAKTTGSITALLVLVQLVTVTYTGCTVIGIPAVISPAQYVLSADGLVAIENTINISVGGIGNCSIKVGPQDLGTVKYKTVGTEILQESAVKNIASTGSGGACGTGALAGGTYTGNNLVFEDGGSIGWS